MPAKKSARKNAKSKGAAKHNRKSTRAPATRDGMRMTLSTYIEVAAAQPANIVNANGDTTINAVGGVVGYSIKCDPANLTVRVGKQSTGQLNVSRINPATSGELAESVRVSMERFEKFKTMYRQFRVDSVSLKITTDRHCGLDNPVLMLQDTDDATPVVDAQQAYIQAHKSAIMTESNRTCYYSFRPTTAEQKQFHNISDGVASRPQYLKVLQELEPNSSAVCKHRIEVTMQVSMKDSKTDLSPAIP